MTSVRADPRAFAPPRRRAAAALVAGGILAALVVVALSATVGTVGIGLGTVCDALVAFDPLSPHHQVVRNLRLPRAVAAALVGASLAAAGAVLQGTTRNPLASPGILGVNAGAALALAAAFAFLPQLPLHALAGISMAGALLGVLAVVAVGAAVPGGLTPVRLVLAGAAVTALLASLTAGVVIYFAVHEDVLFFTAGGVSGVRWDDVRMLLPWTLAGLAASVALAPSVAVLHLGDEVATGVGLHAGRVRIAAAAAVVVLAGVSVAVAGPVGFVGLVVPHAARLLVGSDDRVVVPVSAALGAVLLGVADIGTRLLHPTREVPLGMVTALVGVPLFLRLVRRHDAA